MDIIVSSNTKIKGMYRFSFFEHFILYLYLIVPFTCFAANYSIYYIPYLNVFSSLVAVCCFLIANKSFKDYRYEKYVLIYFFVCLFVWSSPFFFHQENPSVKLIYELMYASSFLLLCDSAKMWIYDKFIKILSIILFLGLCEFLLSQVGIVSILGETIRPYSTNTNIYYQTYFNILPSYFSSGNARFQSIAEEPGLVGTLCFFLISTIDVRKYKLSTAIFFISGVLSMSLAFYLLIILWGICNLYKISTKYILTFFIIFAISGTIFYDRIESIIIERVTMGLEEGNLDNRNSYQVEKLYEDTYNSFERFVCGIGNRTFERMDTGNSAGIKKMIVQYGFVMLSISIISFIILYTKIIGFNRNSFIVLILFLLSLYQRFDLNLSTNIIAIFGSFASYNYNHRK